jgi:CheY-like chemotaxis protein
VVEDNAVNRLVIEGLLVQLGLQVHQAHDGQQALDLLQQGIDTPDLILMDLQMPVLDGYATTLALRQWEADTGRARVPIIALTADAFEEDRQRCLAVGMDDFLTKPIALAALQAALQAWLAPTTQPLAATTELAPVQALNQTLKQVMDLPHFKTTLAELVVLLAHNKFDAIAQMEALQAIAGDTALKPELAVVADLVKNFRFKEAAAALQQLASHRPT